MTVYSGIFNSVRDAQGRGDRLYDAWWFALYFSTFIGNGVFPNPSNQLQVIAGENMNVVVKPGKAWINGYFLYSDNDFILPIENSDGLLKRIDSVVLRLDHITREVQIVVKKGAFASTAAPTALQRDGEAYELRLAEVYVNNGVIELTQSSIKDTRLDNTVCGLVTGTVHQVDTTTLFNQYQTWFEEQMAKYALDMDQWTDDQKAMFLAWSTQHQSDVDIWTTEQQNAFLAWAAGERDGFSDWFNDLQIILDGDVATNLANRILSIEMSDTSFKLHADANNNVFISFPNLFFYVDDDDKVYYCPNGDGNAGVSFGNRLYVWKVV